MSDSSARHANLQPDRHHKNEWLHVFVLSLTKLGDSLVSSRLILAWMLGNIGAAPMAIALLVPLRESLALIPQIGFAGWISAFPVRKGFWIAGSAAQGLALAGMIPCLIWLPPIDAGWAIVALLALFSLSRSLCSVSIKDVMGRTVEKQRRGRVSGNAASIAGVVTLIVAVLLWLAPQSARTDTAVFVAILATAALLWLIAASGYALLDEAPATISTEPTTKGALYQDFLDVIRDTALLQFLLARMLLVATALSIPYLVILLQRVGDAALSGLAVLLAAEGLSAMLSGRVWGIWSDHAAQRVMAFAGLLSGVLLVSAIILAKHWPVALGHPWVSGLLLFGVATAHHGVRIGRSTYLIDMTTDDNRARYTAVANTLMGPLLLAGAGLGVIDTLAGTEAVLWLLALLALAGAWRSLTLRPV